MKKILLSLAPTLLFILPTVYVSIAGQVYFGLLVIPIIIIIFLTPMIITGIFFKKADEIKKLKIKNRVALIMFTIIILFLPIISMCISTGNYYGLLTIPCIILLLFTPIILQKISQKIIEKIGENRRLKIKKTLNSWGEFLGVLIVLLICGCGIYYLLFDAIDYGFLSSEITAYPVVYSGYIKEAKVPTTFKINPEQQYVISDHDGQLTRLIDCTVKDRENWSCLNEKIGVKDGKFYPDNYNNNGIYFVSKWRWSLVNFGYNE